MTSVVLFPPNDAPAHFGNVTDVSIDSQNGVLTFTWQDGTQKKQYQTTVPYTVRQDIAG
jgi:hypothetical protein